MKKVFFIVLFFSLCNVQQISTKQQNEIKVEQLQYKKSAYTYYVWMKELLYVPCYFMWLVDYKKINNASICCKKCNYSFGCFYTYGFLVGEANNNILSKLKKLMLKGSKESIQGFLIALHTERQTECFNCMQFSGWYIQTISNALEK